MYLFNYLLQPMLLKQSIITMIFVYFFSVFCVGSNPIYVNLGDIGSACNKANTPTEANNQENCIKVCIIKLLFHNFFSVHFLLNQLVFFIQPR